MINPVSITEKLLFSTVRIETQTAEGRGTGTGFFFSYRIDPQRTLLVIITNKHVVKGALTGQFHLHQADRAGPDAMPLSRSFPVPLNNFETQWIGHPVDEVDLCAMPVQFVVNEAIRRGNPPFYATLDESFIPTEAQLSEFSAMEEVVMVGYPNGLWDAANNFPLLRHGATASHPAIDFNGKPELVIDAACFPGSSGFPVVLVRSGSYYKKTGCTVVMAGEQIFLLGALYAGPIREAEGRIEVRPIPTSMQPIPVTQQMIHLGYVVKAREILALGEHIRSTYKNKLEQDRVKTASAH